MGADQGSQVALSGLVPTSLLEEMPPEPLDRTMDRFAEGDDSAFIELAEGLEPRLRAFFKRLSGSREMADDLTQETFLRIHRARGSFARGRAVVPWAYTIGRNCFISYVRTKKTRLSQRSIDITEIDIATGPDVDAEGAVVAQQIARTVMQALEAMPIGHREAFVLLRYEGLSVATAAQLVGISEAALKVRAFRAYKALRAALR